MRKKLLLVSVMSLSLAWTAFSAHAEDDVYVDLSVLNELQTPANASQPLFPVVTKKAAPVKKAAKPAKKTAVKTVKAPQPEVIPAAAPKTAPVVKKEMVIEAEPVKNEAAGETDEAVDITVKKPEIIVSRPAELSSSAAAEPKAADALREAISHNSYKPKADAVAPLAESATQNQTSAEVTPVPAAVVTPIPADDRTAVSMFKAETALQISPETPQSAVETAPAPETAASSNVVKFPSDDYELSDADKQQIDSVIASFADAKANKIAITAYNLDDGKDVFYRKRLSLNRAIEVRSYLLNKGYKNYSIKVINISAGDERENTVELSELK